MTCHQHVQVYSLQWGRVGTNFTFHALIPDYDILTRKPTHFGPQWVWVSPPHPHPRS